MYRYAAGGLAEYGDLFRSTAERGSVLLHPLECGDLVHVSVVALWLLRMLAAQCGEREKTQAPQTVVEGDQDDALLGELDPGCARPGAAAEHERAAVDPHHDRQLCLRRGLCRSPHIDKQAIFRRSLRNRRSAAWKGCLRAIRAELARV